MAQLREKLSLHFILEKTAHPRTIVGEKNYFLLLSILAGLLSGCAAVLLKSFAHGLHVLTELAAQSGAWPAFLMPLFPCTGIFFCILFVRLFVKRRKYEKSLAGVIESTTNGTADIPVQKTYSHIITSGMSVGLGVSAGLEAPIALTGSAIGSNLAKLFRLGREGRTLLLACGGAAGVSAVFNSPVAGALFACEILLPEFSVPALIPLLISSAAAAVVAHLLYHYPTFSLEVSDWAVQNLHWYILLGVAAGLVSAYVIRTSLLISKRFGIIRNVWVRGAAACIMLYFVFLLLPILQGEGYSFINHLVRGDALDMMAPSPVCFLFENRWMFLALAGLLVFAKAAVSSVCLAGGGDGGIFAPSMFTGALLGFFCARLVRMLDFYGSAQISETNFIAIGMGGVLAGVMHAPMTGMFLIAEITGGYKLFIPLMIVTSLSYFISRALTKYNVYKSVIAQRGGTPDRSREVAAIASMHVGDFTEHDFTIIRPTDTLRMLLGAVMGSKRNIFPVVDTDNRLVGLVTLDNIRPFLLDTQLYDVALVYDIMSGTGPVLNDTDTLSDATKLFERLQAWNLPVVHNGVYQGFVSKSGVFDRYRDAVKDRHDFF